MSELAAARSRFAEEIRRLAELRSIALVHAFATVPRERFVGPGPWSLWDTTAWQYVDTPDADPRHVYRDAPVALVRNRLLNNGQPSFVAKLIDALDPRPGDRVVHIGCGTGYFSAILAHLVGTTGRVVAIECDCELAARAADNLADAPNVSVIHGDGCAYDPGEADGILVNAGATHPCGLWLDRVAGSGRLILPLVRANGVGVVVKIVRGVRGYDARVLTSVAIFPCLGAVDTDADEYLARAFARLERSDQVRGLRRDAHAAADSCWVHGKGYCLSTLAS
jgi:protein-L-isoaspartate(D-aspartate) O-methyltransferase